MERKLAACSVLFGFGICVAVLGGYGLVATQCTPLTIAEKEQLRGGEDCYETTYVDCSESLMPTCAEHGCDEDDYCWEGQGDYEAMSGADAFWSDESDGGFTNITYFDDVHCVDVYNCGNSEGKCLVSNNQSSCPKGDFDFEAEEFVEASAWGDCCSSVGG